MAAQRLKSCFHLAHPKPARNENFKHTIRIIADDAIHFPRQHALDIFALVYRPHHDAQCQRVRFLDLRFVDIAEIRRPDRAAGGFE